MAGEKIGDASLRFPPSPRLWGDKLFAMTLLRLNETICFRNHNFGIGNVVSVGGIDYNNRSLNCLVDSVKILEWLFLG